MGFRLWLVKRLIPRMTMVMCDDAAVVVFPLKKGQRVVVVSRHVETPPIPVRGPAPMPPASSPSSLVGEMLGGDMGRNLDAVLGLDPLAKARAAAYNKSTHRPPVTPKDGK